MPKPPSESIYLMTTIPQLTARDYVARLKQQIEQLQKELEWRKGFGNGLQNQNNLLRAQLDTAKKVITESDTRLARAESWAESWAEDLIQGINDLVKRAEQAEQELERERADANHYYNETWRLSNAGVKVINDWQADATSLEDLLAKSKSTAIAANQNLERVSGELENAWAEINDLRQGTNDLALRAQDDEEVIDFLAAQIESTQTQAQQLSHDENVTHEKYILFRDEANTLKSAFEEAHARCEQLERDNQQLTTALDNMAVVIRVLLGTKEAI